MPRHSRHMRHRRYIRHDRHDPFLRVSSAGAMQFSLDGSTSWASTIPGTSLKVNTDVDYYIRIDPATIDPADDGSYRYQFALVGSADGDGGNTAGIGGLNITWSGNLAHITGKVPADQVGKIFSVTGSVTDKTSNSVSATPIAATWVA